MHSPRRERQRHRARGQENLPLERGDQLAELAASRVLRVSVQLERRAAAPAARGREDNVPAVLDQHVLLAPVVRCRRDGRRRQCDRRSARGAAQTRARARHPAGRHAARCVHLAHAAALQSRVRWHLGRARD
eukprot:Amastigsp_a841524_153.p4 type:complete len:132 gc:universal Amastigsp_a841524_153:696-301(-)